MTVKEEQKLLKIQNRRAFLYLTDLVELVNIKDVLEIHVERNEIDCFIIISSGINESSHLNQEKKIELYKLFQNFPILTIVVIDNICNGDLLLLAMMCDIRLGGENLSIHFPNESLGMFSDFEDKCKLLMGRETSSYTYASLLGTIIHSEEAIKLRLINQIIHMDNDIQEVNKYLDRLLGSKNSCQIKRIIKVFHSYKRYGINSSTDFIVEEEIKQFCYLASKDLLHDK